MGFRQERVFLRNRGVENAPRVIYNLLGFYFQIEVSDLDEFHGVLLGFLLDYEFDDLILMFMI